MRLWSARPCVSRGVTRPLRRARTVAGARARITQDRASRGRPFFGGYLMSSTPVFVGVDVGKAELAIALSPSGESWSVANDETGIRSLEERLRPLTPVLIVLEATGGYESAVAAVLAAAGLPLVVAN